MKKITYLLRIGIALIITFIPAYNTQAANDRALFWQIKHQQSTVYLFGSIHLANASFYPLRDTITKAFDQSETLVVEVNLNTSNAIMIQEWLEEHGRYPEGQTIQQDLSAATYRQLSTYIKQQGMDITAYQNQKPGLLVTAISSLKMMQLGLSPAYGLDLFFLQRAGKDNKQILQLETFEQQLLMLIDMPNPELLVLQTLSQMNNAHVYMDQLISAWKTGDEQQLSQLLIDGELEHNPEFLPIFDRLFTQRNIAMSKKISDYLKKTGTHFVVVGAGHLVGKSSIIELLNKQGFKPERL